MTAHKGQLVNGGRLEGVVEVELSGCCLTRGADACRRWGARGSGRWPCTARAGMVPARKRNLLVTSAGRPGVYEQAAGTAEAAPVGYGMAAWVSSEGLWGGRVAAAPVPLRARPPLVAKRT